MLAVDGVQKGASMNTEIYLELLAVGQAVIIMPNGEATGVPLAVAI